jgi:Putative beta barrel porin-7 (BBP7)
MRKYLTTTFASLLAAGSAIAQAPAVLSGVPVGQPATGIIIPAPTLPPPTLPPPLPAEPPPAPPPGFGVGLPGRTVVSPLAVRPPEPVPGAQIEVPPGEFFWVDFDYLLWRSKGGLLPPLVVAVGGQAALASPVNPRQAVAVSDDRINGDVQSGFRIGGGMWLDKPHGTGVEASYMAFMQSGDVATYFGAPGAVLARPFGDVTRGVPALFQLSTPSQSTQGMASVRTTFDADGFEVNLLRRGPAMIGEEMYWIVGLRYFGLDESLMVEAASQAGAMRAGAFDSFTTRNNFYGAQFGGRWSFTRNDLTVDLTMKMALGGMGQEAVVQGGSSVILPGGRIDRPGGLLALGPNIGDHDRSKLVLLRDISISVGYCVLPNVTVHLGYDFLWLSNVLRPGEQIDLGVNPRLLPFSAAAPSGPLRPAFKFNGDTFYMHGITVGVAVQF